MIIGVDASRAFVPQRTGTENYSYQLLKAMLALPSARKHHWVLFTRGKESTIQAKALPWLKQDYVEVVEIPWRRLWTQGGLAWETWKRRLDVLFIPAHTLPLLRKPGIKTVVTIHGLEYEWLPEYRTKLQRWYLPLSTVYAVKQAKALIAVSDFTAKEICGRLKAQKDKIHVIHEGVAKEFFEKKRPKTSVEAVFRKYHIERPFALFIGTLQPRKNLPFLVETWAALRKQFPEHRRVTLVLAGGKGWLTGEIEAAPKRYGVEEAVRMTGRVDDEELAVLLQEARIYIQPSITEGFGLPVLEAMAAGTPVVTSAGGALPEAAGKAGLVVRGFDIDGWVRELHWSLTNVSWRSQATERGRERAAHFSWTQAAQRTLRVLIS